MGTISIEKSQNMYWLGRYMERVFTTLKSYTDYYDKMLDGSDTMYQKFCQQLGIPDVYGSQETFVENYLFDGKDAFSVASSLQRAFDNAIILRDEISSESLAYIHLAMESLDIAKDSPERMLDLQQVLDDIYAFWGSVDDNADSELCRNLMKCGRYQERLDLFVRVGYKLESVEKVYAKLQARIKKAGMPYQQDKMDCIGECLVSQEVLQESRGKLLGCLSTLFAR